MPTSFGNAWKLDLLLQHRDRPFSTLLQTTVLEKNTFKTHFTWFELCFFLLQQVIDCKLCWSVFYSLPKPTCLAFQYHCKQLEVFRVIEAGRWNQNTRRIYVSDKLLCCCFEHLLHNHIKRHHYVTVAN